MTRCPRLNRWISRGIVVGIVIVGIVWGLANTLIGIGTRR